MLDAATLKMVVTLGALYCAKQIDATDEDNVFYVRCLYASAQALMFLSYALMKWRIAATNDKRVLKVTESDLTPPPALAAMMGAPPPSSEKQEFTVQQYDAFKLMAVVKQGAQAVCITSFIHYKYEYLAPLVLQSVMGVMTLATSELARIHLLGQSDAAPGNEGLKRPWKAPPGMMDQLKKVQDDAAAASGAAADQQAKKVKRDAKKALKKAGGSTDKMD